MVWLDETETRKKLITPAILGAGWDPSTQVREEVVFTVGRIIVRGKLVTRGAGKRADSGRVAVQGCQVRVSG